MINFKWLSVEDFKGRFKITENIPTKDLDIAINDSFDFDVLTTLPDEMLNDIKDVLLINPIQWKASKAYVVGDKVNYDGVYYVALENSTGSLPASDNADWQEIALMSFWTDYVKPFFMCCAYYRFLLWHGANITQYGSRQNTEDTSQELTDKRKGELLADISGKKDIFLARLTKAFKDAANTFDGVTYQYDSTDTKELNQGVRIWGQNGKRKRICNDKNNSQWL